MVVAVTEFERASAVALVFFRLGSWSCFTSLGVPKRSHPVLHLLCAWGATIQWTWNEGNSTETTLVLFPLVKTDGGSLAELAESCRAAALLRFFDLACLLCVPACD